MQELVYVDEVRLPLFVLILESCLNKDSPYSDQFRSDIIRVRTYFAFVGRDIRTKIVRTKVSFGRVLFGDRPFGDRSFGDRAFGDLTVYRYLTYMTIGQRDISLTLQFANIKICQQTMRLCYVFTFPQTVVNLNRKN
jgi:hypothetical protein